MITKEKRLLLEKKIKEARTSFPAFFNFVFGLKLQPFQARWIELAERHKRVLILAPQEHGKSTVMALAYPLFLLGRNPKMIIKIISHSDRKAVDRILAIRNAIAGENFLSKKLHLVFPHLRPSSSGVFNKHQLTLAGSPFDHASIEAFSIMAAASGSRAHLLIFDDPCDYKNSVALPQLREKIKESIDNVFINFLFPQGRIIWICTPWHKLDATSKLEKNPEFVTLRQPIGPSFEPLWPDVWPKEALLERSRTTGTRAFNRAFRLLPLEDETGVFFDPFWLEQDQEPPEELITTIGLDPALGGKYSKSKTVFFVLEGKPPSYFRPKRIIRGDFTAPDTIRFLAKLCQEEKPLVVGIEGNAYQLSLVQFANEAFSEFSLKPLIQPYYTGENLESPEFGLPAIAKQMQQGFWKLKEPHDYQNCACGLCIWQKELAGYPHAQTKDTVMAMWLAWKALVLYQGEPRISILKFGTEASQEISFR